MTVYILYHLYDSGEYGASAEDEIVGVYSSHEKAVAACRADQKARYWQKRWVKKMPPLAGVDVTEEYISSNYVSLYYHINPYTVDPPETPK
jgi:hypothetical protein